MRNDLEQALDELRDYAWSLSNEYVNSLVTRHRSATYSDWFMAMLATP